MAVGLTGSEVGVSFSALDQGLVGGIQNDAVSRGEMVVVGFMYDAQAELAGCVSVRGRAGVQANQGGSGTLGRRGEGDRLGGQLGEDSETNRLMLVLE